VGTLLHTVARETSSSSFSFEFCHSTRSTAVIVLLKVGRVSHEEGPVTDVRAGIDQMLRLESHRGSWGQQRFLQVLERGGKQTRISTDLYNVLRNPFT